MEELNYKIENLRSTLNKIKNEITSTKEKDHEVLTRRSEKNSSSYKIFRPSSYNKNQNQHKTSQNFKPSRNYFQFSQKEKSYFNSKKNVEKINLEKENFNHQKKYEETSIRNNKINPKFLNQNLVKYISEQPNKDSKNKTTTKNSIKKTNHKRINDYFILNYNKNHKKENIKNNKNGLYCRNFSNENLRNSNMFPYNYNINNNTYNELFLGKNQNNKSCSINKFAKLFQYKKNNNSSSDLSNIKKYFNQSIDSKIRKVNSSRNDNRINDNYINSHTDYISQVNFPVAILDKSIFDLSEEEKSSNRNNKNNINIFSNDIYYGNKRDNCSNKFNKKCEIKLNNPFKRKNQNTNYLRFEEELIKQNENNDSIDDVYSKAKLFNKYGYKNYKKYLEYFGGEDTVDNLKKYKNYIINIKEEENNFMKQINIYKTFCKKFIEVMTNDEVKDIIGEAKEKFARNNSNNYIHKDLDNFLLLNEMKC